MKKASKISSLTQSFEQQAQTKAMISELTSTLQILNQEREAVIRHSEKIIEEAQALERDEIFVVFKHDEDFWYVRYMLSGARESVENCIESYKDNNPFAAWDLPKALLYLKEIINLVQKETEAKKQIHKQITEPRGQLAQKEIETVLTEAFIGFVAPAPTVIMSLPPCTLVAAAVAQERYNASAGKIKKLEKR